MNCNRTLCRLSAGLLSHLMVVILSNLSMRPLCAMHLSNACWQIQVHSDPLQPSIDLPLFCRETRGRTALNMSSYCVIDSRLYGSVLLSQRTSSRADPVFRSPFIVLSLLLHIPVSHFRKKLMELMSGWGERNEDRSSFQFFEAWRGSIASRKTSAKGVI